MNKIDEKATHVGSDARDSTSGRRRFVRGVSIAIPVSLTVSARSALSATCATVSANASIALANSHNATGDVNQTCLGAPPEGWVVQQPTGTQKTTQPALLQSPSGFIGLDQKFGDVFSTTPPLKNSKMSEAVKNQDEFVRYIAAAYLNLVNNKVTGVYSLTQLQAMWDGRNHGYSPLLGSTVIWYEQDIKKYLASTWS